jgi:hypothetical protein
LRGEEPVNGTPTSSSCAETRRRATGIVVRLGRDRVPRRLEFFNEDDAP